MCRETGSTLVDGILCGACCPVCKDFDKALVASCFDDRRNREIHQRWLKHVRLYHFPPRIHSGNGAPTGAFAFTLNMSPGDGLTQDDMVIAVRKLMAQKTCPVKRYAWYLEFGDDEAKTHPHIHGMYETEANGRIPQRQFKRAWPIWDESQRLGRGHRGGYHDVARNEEGYSNYIREDFAMNGIGDSHGVA